MTDTIEINNLLSIDLEEVQLIHIPSQFTSIEAKLLEKLFQQVDNSYQPIQTDL